MNKSSLLATLGLLVFGGLLVSALIYVLQGKNTESSGTSTTEDVPSSIAGESKANLDCYYPWTHTLDPHSTPYKPMASPNATNLTDLRPYNYDGLSDPDLIREFWAAIAAYELPHYNLMDLAADKDEYIYVSNQENSITSFFQLITSKVSEILCYQAANNLDEANGNCIDFYLSDESGAFDLFVSTYHAHASEELKRLIITAEELRQVCDILENMEPDHALSEAKDKAELLHKLIFSRNVHALVLPLFSKLGNLDMDDSNDTFRTAFESISGAASGHQESDGAETSASMRKVFGLVSLCHKLTHDPSAFSLPKIRHYFIFASLLFPFNMHYKEFKDLDDPEVASQCCTDSDSDRTSYFTYNFDWETIGLPEGYEDNYETFCYQVIYETVTPLIESTREVEPQKADAYAQELRDIQLVDDFVFTSTRPLLNRFFKDLRTKRDYTVPSDLVLFLIDNQFGYISPCD